MTVKKDVSHIEEDKIGEAEHQADMKRSSDQTRSNARDAMVQLHLKSSGDAFKSK